MTCLRLACSSLVLFLVACSGDDRGGGTDAGRADSGPPRDSGPAPDTGPGVDSGRGVDAGPGTDAGVDCSTAMEDQPCSVEGAFCGGPCTDECMFCNILACRMGTWERMEAFPAPCFDCGPMERCSSLDEYCEELIGGPKGSMPAYTCRDAPPACGTDRPTCACVAPDPEATCRMDADGVTVTIFAP